MYKNDVFNETTIMFLVYHMLVFTNWVSDPTRKYEMGWSMIFFTLLNIVVNLSGIVRQSVRAVYFKCKKKKTAKKEAGDVYKRTSELLASVNGVPSEAVPPQANALEVIKESSE